MTPSLAVTWKPPSTSIRALARHGHRLDAVGVSEHAEQHAELGDTQQLALP